MATPERIPPIPDALSEPFWQAAREGTLLIQRCPSTGKYQWYPRLHSLHDWDAEPEWVEASGRGVVHSFSIVHRSTAGLEKPYVLAVVELEEGVRLTANVVDVPVDEVSIGMPVEVTFARLDETFSLPLFAPAR